MKIQLLPVVILLQCLTSLTLQSQPQVALLQHEKIAMLRFQDDTAWYLHNIPFFDCSDKEIEDVYYYRWKLFKAHIRNTGPGKFVVTEFIDHVPWDREPWCTINAASMHHIYEGRWLRDPRYMDGYIDYLYQHGGNDRRYSESIADATYARFLVNGDSAFITSQLDSMVKIYNAWNDHRIADKHLYFIPAMPDATEYTIASIDASGGKDGFEDGEAFRPTINSYMYANALAISRIARLKGDDELSHSFAKKAEQLKLRVETDLWNDSLAHFTDRFKVDNEYVHYWNFIRGRELAGFVPWYFELPADNAKFAAAWSHLKGTDGLLGKHGFRTNEPGYEYYFRQFVFSFGKPGSQWNGPSWPYQTSQVLTGMANLLNDYHQHVFDTNDYLKDLRLYTKQHFLPNGEIDLVENYDPNTGGPIVYYYWSNHYNHSTYNNLVITGLCGLRPTDSDTLFVNPLIDGSIDYFCLEDVKIRGHEVTVFYDKTGKRYQRGTGLHVLLDGEEAGEQLPNGKFFLVVETLSNQHQELPSANVVLNLTHEGFPALSASVNNIPDSLKQANDGRIWYFPEVRNRWSTIGSKNDVDWLQVEFGQPKEISNARLYFFSDSTTLFVPETITLEYQHNGKWAPVKVSVLRLRNFTPNTVTSIPFEPLIADQLRVTFQHHGKDVAVTEFECY